MRLPRVVLGAVVLLGATAFAALADGPKRALIITNQSYPDAIGALENTHHDGERMTAALTTLGFAVVHRRDLDKSTTIGNLGQSKLRRL
jgi:caspase domain-containing protein